MEHRGGTYEFVPHAGEIELLDSQLWCLHCLDMKWEFSAPPQGVVLSERDQLLHWRCIKSSLQEPGGSLSSFPDILEVPKFPIKSVNITLLEMSMFDIR